MKAIALSSPTAIEPKRTIRPNVIAQRPEVSPRSKLGMRRCTARDPSNGPRETPLGRPGELARTGGAPLPEPPLCRSVSVARERLAARPCQRFFTRQRPLGHAVAIGVGLSLTGDLGVRTGAVLVAGGDDPACPARVEDEPEDDPEADRDRREDAAEIVDEPAEAEIAGQVGRRALVPAALGLRRHQNQAAREERR